MKRCLNCGTPMDNDASFCQKCGQKFQEPHTTQPTYAYNKPRKRAVWVTVLLWILFWPIMIIVTIAKTSKLTKPVKLILIGVLVVFMIGIVFVNQGNSEPQTAEGSPAPSSSLTADDPEESQSNELFSEVIEDEALRTNFLSACEQIGMDYNQIKNLEQVDDWVSGPRYSFTYQGTSFRLYANMDSTVNAIKLGADTDVYKQGFEPYQVQDYIADSAVTAKLQVMSQEYVKTQLNYPSTADFAWLDWTFGRDHELYTVSSVVTAQNAFGVEDELPFTLIYQVTNDSAKLVYFELGGNVISDDMAAVSVPERQEIPDAGSSDTTTDGENMVLVYGELGAYGKSVDVDGNTTIHYCVPEGTYTVVNNGKWCMVYVAKDEYYENMSGYMENEIVDTLDFSEYGESKTLTVKSGEHIELTINASVTLTPVK